MIYIHICINILFFLCGLLVGSHFLGSNSTTSSDFVYNYLPNKERKKQKEKEKVLEKVKSVSIDESIVVIDQNTDDLEKHFDEITETKIKDVNIQKSIDKLSQLRKGK